MSRTRAIIRHIRTKARPPTRNEARHVAIGSIIATGLVIGACIAFAKIPALQLDKPKPALASVKTSSVVPSAMPQRPVAPTRYCMDNPKRPPPCAGIGRK